MRGRRLCRGVLIIRYGMGFCSGVVIDFFLHLNGRYHGRFVISYLLRGGSLFFLHHLSQDRFR